MSSDTIECGYVGGAADAPDPVEIGELKVTSDGGIAFRTFEIANMVPAWRTVLSVSGGQIKALGVETDTFLERGGRANAFLWGGVAGMAMRDRKVNRKNTPLVAVIDRGAEAVEVVVFGTLASEAAAWLAAAEAIRAQCGHATRSPHEVLDSGSSADAPRAPAPNAPRDRAVLVGHARALLDAGVVADAEFAEIAGRIAALD